MPAAGECGRGGLAVVGRDAGAQVPAQLVVGFQGREVVKAVRALHHKGQRPGDIAAGAVAVAGGVEVEEPRHARRGVGIEPNADHPGGNLHAGQLLHGRRGAGSAAPAARSNKLNKAQYGLQGATRTAKSDANKALPRRRTL